MKAQIFFMSTAQNLFTLLTSEYPESCAFMNGIETELFNMYKIRSIDKIVQEGLLDFFNNDCDRILNHVVSSLYFSVKNWYVIYKEHEKLLNMDLLKPISTTRTTQQTINDKVNAYDSGDTPSDKSEQNLNKVVTEQTNTIKSYSDYFQSFLDFENNFNFLSIIFNSIDKQLFLSIY